MAALTEVTESSLQFCGAVRAAVLDIVVLIFVFKCNANTVSQSVWDIGFIICITVVYM